MTLSSPLLDLIATTIRLLVLAIKIVYVWHHVCFLCLCVILFIVFLIETPKGIHGDLGRLEVSERSKDTDVLGDLNGVLTISWLVRSATLTYNSTVLVC